ncbi:423af4fe-a76d-438d-bdb4-51553e1284f2 [Sclerotinia trifoliorum]|uniref:423af4fe-a76d-438d-bdb4-51553e1284f2 n=1 Tax=Sclerotinia trifoliorum TaxID=28548 RepID=A0A8H2VXV2_9HELO|nr:423af4fe-a76d-438d-bdb4-51553e1284f2 [Sclerotinia trifoliorum]
MCLNVLVNGLIFNPPEVRRRSLPEELSPSSSLSMTLSITLSIISVVPLCLLLQLGLTTAQFAIYEPDWLDSTLGDACINALSANFNCVEYVQTFMQLRYRTSLENVTLTDMICTSDCSASLKNWFDSVTANCAGKTLNDGNPTAFGGYMWAGFNETCVKDPRTKQYCNDIMFNFTDVPNITSMPREELCHTCHIRRLAMMQSSQYSIYDDFFKEQLEYVYTQCGSIGPTTIPPALVTTITTPTPYCVSGKRYTTLQTDTCESIANSTSVSSASLYMGNQALLPSCLTISPGISLCLPITCQTYYVQPTDTCISIEMALGLDFDQLLSYNSWLNPTCSNLQPATDFYGKIICVSPQGGTFTGTAAPPVPTEPSDGYTRVSIPPPADIPIAPGTTLSCGKWHVVLTSDTCTTICVQSSIEASLFRLVNPSLASDTCTLSLVPGTALCVGPTYSWNITAPATSMVLESTSTVVGVRRGEATMVMRGEEGWL